MEASYGSGSGGTPELCLRASDASPLQARFSCGGPPFADRLELLHRAADDETRSASDDAEDGRAALLRGPPPLSRRDLCVVCGDRSSGRHYGQPSCEGCKAFFKRSIRRRAEYTCKGNRRCVVDCARRNQCQSCRFNRCIEKGMRREGVQQGAATAQRRGGASPNEKLACVVGDSPYATAAARGYGGHCPAADGCRSGVNWSWLLRQSLFPGLTPYPDLANSLLSTVVHAMTVTVSWASDVESFGRLRQADQVTLLKASWSQLFVLDLAHDKAPVLSAALELLCSSAADVCCLDRRAHGDGGTVRPAAAAPPSQYVAAAAGAADADVRSSMRALKQHTAWLRRLNMNDDELHWVKAAALARPDVPGITEHDAVECIQEVILRKLSVRVASGGMTDGLAYKSSSNSPSRLGQLLLCLPSLQNVGSRLLEHLLLGQLVGIPIRVIIESSLVRRAYFDATSYCLTN